MFFFLGLGTTALCLATFHYLTTGFTLRFWFQLAVVAIGLIGSLVTAYRRRKRNAEWNRAMAKLEAYREVVQSYEFEEVTG